MSLCLSLSEAWQSPWLLGIKLLLAVCCKYSGQEQKLVFWVCLLTAPSSKPVRQPHVPVSAVQACM